MHYTMVTRDLHDIYAQALRPAALGLGHIRIRQIMAMVSLLNVTQ